MGALQLRIGLAKGTDVIINAATDALAPALEELHDALARVRAQARVIRLAITGMGDDERDIRAIISSLDAITDELQDAGTLLRR